MIYSDIYKDKPCYILENDFIKLIVLKDFGAKVASLRYKKQDFEVLFQPLKDYYDIPVYGDSFEKYDTSGWDEMYPTIDKCEYPFDTIHKGLEMPDHGELWSETWNYEVEGEILKSYLTSRRFGYTFTRSILLKENQVKVYYEVTNLEKDVHRGIWAFHGLLACDEESRLELHDVKEVLNVHDSSILGKAGTIHSYPLTKDLNGFDYALDKIKAESALKTEKFYVNGSVNEGRAGITLNHERLKLSMEFPKESIPYLGVWINEGGFKGEYNCALEPSNGFYDSADIAAIHGKINEIKPFEKVSWYLNLVLEEIN